MDYSFFAHHLARSRRIKTSARSLGFGWALELTLLVFSVLCIACVRSGETEKLCDLRELDPSLKTLGKMERTADGDLQFVKVPDKPSLVVCECEIDRWLQSVEHRDPIEDARAAADAGHLFFLARPLLGSLVPVGIDMKVQDVRQQMEVRRIPGVDEHASCFERERLTVAALEYAERYNETIMLFVKQDTDS